MRRRDLSRGGWVVAAFMLLGIAACGGGGFAAKKMAEGTGSSGGSSAAGGQRSVQGETNPGYDSQYRQQTASSEQNYAKGQLQLIHQDGIAALPGWQRELLDDPDWAEPGYSFSQPADKSRELKSGQRKAPGPQAGAAPDRALLVRWLAPEAWAADHNVDEKYLVRSGSLDIHADSVQDCVTKISSIASRFGGSVTDSSVSKDDAGHHSGYVTLRVPAAKFFDTWNELGKIGEASNQNIKSEDVGQEYVTSITHMRTLMTEQATLEKMLADALAVQRSRGLGEAYKVLLDTQSRLSEVTEEIQGVEDRVNALSDQITRSSITVNLTENPRIPVAKPDTFNWGVNSAFNSSVRELMETARGLINGTIHYIVTLQWVWLLIAFFAIRWTYRRAKVWLKSQKQRQALENAASGQAQA